MGWAEHAAHMGKRRGACRVVVWRPEGRNCLGVPGIDGRIILNRPSASGLGTWTGLIWCSTWVR
jgi:hypothetical protein